jgi:hypothetical protein
MDSSTQTLPRVPTKRPRQHLAQFASQTLAQKIDVIVVRLSHDDFVDIKPVPYPVRGLAKGS